MAYSTVFLFHENCNIVPKERFGVVLLLLPNFCPLYRFFHKIMSSKAVCPLKSSFPLNWSPLNQLSVEKEKTQTNGQMLS